MQTRKCHADANANANADANRIRTKNKGDIKIDQKQRALDTTWFLYLSMHIQNFIKIHPFVLKILRKNTILHQSRAITLLFINEFSPFAIPNHSFLMSMSMQSLKKIGKKLLKLESGNDILHQSRAITLLFINEFSPFAIPNHSSLISMFT